MISVSVLDVILSGKPCSTAFRLGTLRSLDLTATRFIRPVCGTTAEAHVILILVLHLASCHIAVCTKVVAYVSASFLTLPVRSTDRLVHVFTEKADK